MPVRVRPRVVVPLLCALALAACDAPPGAPPNLVLVTLDTTRADVAADPVVAPHLAALARRGLRFERAWSPATSTTPAHASIMTGLPVEQHGAASNRAVLAPTFETLAEALAARGYRTAASVSVSHLGSEAGFAQGFERFRPAEKGDARDGAVAVETVLGWLDDWAQGDDPRPFFLWLHLFDPHTPYGPPAAFVEGELARRGMILPARTATPPTVPVFPGPLPTPLSWLEGTTSRAHVEALYRAGVAYADHLTGRLLDHLARLGVESRTVVAVTADHGEALGEHGVFYQHAGLWPATLRVPLLIAGPGVPRGRTSDARVSTLDLHATLLALADDAPKRAPLLASAEAGAPSRRIWFAEAGLAQVGFRDADVHFAHALAAGQFGVVIEERDGAPHVRAIQRYAPGVSWLFDVNADPALERNLAGEPGAGAARYRAAVTERARGSAARIRTRPLDPEQEQQLRALGYAED